MEGGSWHVLCHHKQEHSEGEQDGDPKGDLLTSIRRQTENDHDQHRQQRTRQDDIHDVERVPTSKEQRELHIRIADVGATGEYVLFPHR